MQRIGRQAFDLADGDEICAPQSHLLLKMRPVDGFCAERNLSGALKRKDYVDAANLTKEEKLFLLSEGVAKKGRWAYNRGGKYAAELLENLAHELLGGGETSDASFRQAD